MEKRTEEALRAYEMSEQEIRAHWIWSLCQIAPGDFIELIRRLEDRLQGIPLDIPGLKEKARGDHARIGASKPPARVVPFVRQGMRV